MIIRQISVFIGNRKGRLAELTRLLADNGVNIRALSLADSESFGILRIIVDDTDAVAKLLTDNGLTVSVNSMLSVIIPDRPGGLADMLAVLAEKDISVEYMYAFLSTIDKESACVVMRIEEENEAEKLLKAHGYVGLEAMTTDHTAN